MIHLITGQPGAGKTLYALEYVKREFKDWDIYYLNIPGLTLDWKRIDNIEEWRKLPPKSVLVIDECQKFFGRRGSFGKVPDYIAELAEHRHGGVDIVLVTQGPHLVDKFIHPLVGRHFHVVRHYGMQVATVHEWASIKDNCSKSRRDSQQHTFKYPTATFAEYKSAEVHTVKRRLPLRLIFLACFPVAALVAAWSIYEFQQRQGAPAAKPMAKEGALSKAIKPITGPGGAVAVGGGGTYESIDSARRDYFVMHTPVIPEFPHTAPAYAGVTAPKDAPIPAACVQSASKGCTCYSQQGTKMPTVGRAVCAQIVANGFFIDWQAPPAQGQGLPPSQPATAAPVAYVAPEAVAVAAVPAKPAENRPEARVVRSAVDRGPGFGFSAPVVSSGVGAAGGSSAPVASTMRR